MISSAPIWLVLSLALAAIPAWPGGQGAETDAARDVAHALLLQLLEQYPPGDRAVCVTVRAGAPGSPAVEPGPTVRFLAERGVAAFAGPECQPVRPQPGDTGAVTRTWGRIFHTRTGRPGAIYSIRVAEVTGGRAMLHGGYAFGMTHGASCPYEGTLLAGRWTVRQLLDRPCQVS